MPNSRSIAIITGGSRGIGLAITEKFLKKGYLVHICSNNESDLKNAQSELSKFGDVEYFVLDLSDKNAVLDFTKSWDKPIKVLVNNAGIYLMERLDEDLNIWDKVMNVNLNGLYWITKGLLKHVEDNGRIINISSQLGKKGRAGAAAYAASKFAVRGLTKSWAKELADRGITVNAVCPSWVKTEMLMHDFNKIAAAKHQTFEEVTKDISDNLTLGRMSEPQEIADQIVYLASPEAQHITGQDFFINEEIKDQY